jgi:DNA-binding protein YbaB
MVDALQLESIQPNTLHRVLYPLSSTLYHSSFATNNNDKVHLKPNIMKLSLLSTTLLISSIQAFTPTFSPRTSSTHLNLFGGKKEGGDSSSGGGGGMGGMMDQLAMFKRAQEIASKKNDLDKEIAEMEIIGSAADGSVKVTVQYIPAQMPTNPSPGYDAVNVDIEESYLEGASCEELGEALVNAIRDGETAATKVVGEKYKVLEEEMQAMMGGLGGAMGQ